MVVPGESWIHLHSEARKQLFSDLTELRGTVNDLKKRHELFAERCGRLRVVFPGQSAYLSPKEAISWDWVSKLDDHLKQLQEGYSADLEKEDFKAYMDKLDKLRVTINGEKLNLNHEVTEFTKVTSGWLRRP